MTDLAPIKAALPEKLAFLFEPHRYKEAHGGRGSTKSWTFARALLILGKRTPLRILCAREIQESIRDSVHRLLKDQIAFMDMGDDYLVLASEIRGRRNDTLFSFVGLSALTVDSIKSYEGYDICWVEEAQTTSERSWVILTPTIRKAGSEIWISFNPELESDPTYQRFVVHPPPDCRGVLMNWRDNPWLNKELNDERLHCKATNPDGYPNIWEGECKPAVEGAIYYKELAELQRNGRVCNVPYDPMLLVHLVLDVGGDALTAALIQKNVSEIRIIEYIETTHTDLATFSSVLRERRYNWGRMWLPHDAFARRLEGDFRSTASIMKALQWDVVPKEEISQASIEEGIKITRLAFPRMYFDKTYTAQDQPVRQTDRDLRGIPGKPPGDDVKYTDLHQRMIEACKRYRRYVNLKTEVVGTPVKDPNAHAADTLRYVALNESRMTNEVPGTFVPDRSTSYPPLDRGVGI